MAIYPRISLDKIHLFPILQEKYPEKWNQAKNKFRFLTKSQGPTFNQLKEIAKFFNIPFGYFFLNKLPDFDYPIPHYRTFTSQNFQPSDDLIAVLKDTLKRQEWIKEILENWGQKPLEYAGKFSINDNVKYLVKEAKKILRIEDNWMEKSRNWSSAFNFFVKKMESAGIFVIINGIVCNNTHKPLDINEFRGFVLYDNLAPFVFINNKDFLSGKIFTIIHEFFHILIGESASFDFRDLQPANNEIEKFCNYCSAEFLVPENQLVKYYKNNDNFSYLAKKFKVSQIVIARRLLDLSIISKKEFFDFYSDYIKQDFEKSPKSSGGNSYENFKKRNGERFLKIIKTAYNEGMLLPTDVYRLLKLRRSISEKLLSLIDE